MKISDANGMTIIDGKDTLILSKVDRPIRVCEGVSRIVICNFTIWDVLDNKINSTIAALKYIWGQQ